MNVGEMELEFPFLTLEARRLLLFSFRSSCSAFQAGRVQKSCRSSLCCNAITHPTESPLYPQMCWFFHELPVVIQSLRKKIQTHIFFTFTYPIHQNNIHILTETFSKACSSSSSTCMPPPHPGSPAQDSPSAPLPPSKFCIAFSGYITLWGLISVLV